MIFTTSKPLSEWRKVLHDQDMAGGLLDRVLDRGRFIHLDGPSGRRAHLRLEENLPADTKRLRISGTHTMFRQPEIIWLFGELGTTFRRFARLGRDAQRAHDALSNLTAVTAGISPYATENEVFSIRIAPNCPGLLWLFPGHRLPRARSCSPSLYHYPTALERREPDLFLPRRRHYF